MSNVGLARPLSAWSNVTLRPVCMAPRWRLKHGHRTQRSCKLNKYEDMEAQNRSVFQGRQRPRRQKNVNSRMSKCRVINQVETRPGSSSSPHPANIGPAFRYPFSMTPGHPAFPAAAAAASQLKPGTHMTNLRRADATSVTTASPLPHSAPPERPSPASFRPSPPSERLQENTSARVHTPF